MSGIETAGAVFMVLGLFVYFSSVLGLFRFKFVLNRMHAAAMADTLGIGFILIGCILMRGFSAVTWKFVLVLIFMWLTAPISSHLIAKAEVLTQPNPEKHWEEEEL